MRILSILLNIILIAIVIFMVADNGWPRNIEEQLMVCVFFATPVFSLITFGVSSLIVQTLGYHFISNVKS